MRRALILAAALAATACARAQPFLLDGDARRAVVKYSGDLAATLPFAARHCAGYGRVPHLADHDLDTAYYDCVKP